MAWVPVGQPRPRQDNTATGRMTDDGRPILANKDGSISTERSITVEAEELNGGKPTNIPSLWDGQQLEPREAVRRAIESGNQYPGFNSIEEAETAARGRSAELGNRYSSTDRWQPKGEPRPVQKRPGIFVPGLDMTQQPEEAEPASQPAQTDAPIYSLERQAANMQLAYKQGLLAEYNGLLTDYWHGVAQMRERWGDDIEKDPEKRQRYEDQWKALAETSLNRSKLLTEIQTIPKSAAMRKLETADQQPTITGELGQIWDALTDDPVGLPVDVIEQNLPYMLRTAVTVFLTRRAGATPGQAAVAGGASSAVQEFGSRYIDLRERGMSHEKAWQAAMNQAAAVGAFDAASMGSASKAVDEFFKSSLRRKALDLSKESAKQSIFGAGGEAVAQVQDTLATGQGDSLKQRIATGSRPNPAGVVMEAIAEAPGAVVEGGAMVLGERKPAAPKASPPPSGAKPVQPNVEAGDQPLPPVEADSQAQPASPRDTTTHNVERYQYQRTPGRQTGAKVEVRPLTEEDYQYLVKPVLPQGYANTLAEYQQKHANATHIRVEVDGDSASMQRVGSLDAIRPTGNSVRRFSSFDHPEAQAWAKIDAERASRRDTNSVDLENDSLLTAISKLGGLSREEAEAQGIDPAHMQHRGHRINLTFRKSGLSFDQMAELLAEYGYPVLDQDGRYNPNTLLDRIGEELAGRKAFSSSSPMQSQRGAIEARAMEEDEQARIRESVRPVTHEDLVDLYRSYPDAVESDEPVSALHEADYYPSDFDDSARKLADLAEMAQRVDEAAAEEALQASSDQEAARQLWAIINGGERAEPTSNAFAGSDEAGDIFSDEAEGHRQTALGILPDDGITELDGDIGEVAAGAVPERPEQSGSSVELPANEPSPKGSVPVAGGRDLLGNDTRTTEQLSKVNAKKAKERGEGRKPVPASQGPRGDMFVEAELKADAEAKSKQTDIESVPAPAAKKSRNTVFTDDAAEKARAILRAKLGIVRSGIDPEVMQAGITLAGWHVENGARKFAAFSKAMVNDLGEAIRPYLKSWYLAIKFDPRASAFADDMDSAADLEKSQEPENFGARWDAMGYGERQEIAQGKYTMRNVVHRISGSLWSELSAGERETLSGEKAEAVEDDDGSRDAAELIKAIEAGEDSSAELVRQTEAEVEALLKEAGWVTYRKGKGEFWRKGTTSLFTRSQGDLSQVVVQWKHGDQGAIDAAAHEAATSPKNDLPQPTEAQKEAENYKAGDPITLHGHTIRIENPRGSYRYKLDTDRLLKVFETVRYNSPGDNSRYESALTASLNMRKGNIPEAFERFRTYGNAMNRQFPVHSQTIDEILEAGWFNKMPAHYGRILGTTAPDGDHIDVFLGSKAGDESLPVTVIDTAKVGSRHGKLDEYKVMIGFTSQAQAIKTFEASYKPHFARDELLMSVSTMWPEDFREWLESGDHKRPAAEWFKDRRAASDLRRFPDVDPNQPGDKIIVKNDTRAAGGNDLRLNMSETEDGVDWFSVGWFDPEKRTYFSNGEGFTDFDEAKAYMEKQRAELTDSEPETPPPSTEGFTPGELAALAAFRSKLATDDLNDITQARKLFREASGVGIERNKRVDEILELAVVQQARTIIDEEFAKGAGADQRAFERLVDLYNYHPKLGTRTSTSVENQAYSTPAPLAFLAGRLAGIDPKATRGRVYEPTAGNGMLLIGAKPSTVTANELNQERAAALRLQGFGTVTQGDATTPPSGTFTAIVANPPFGVVKDANGDSKRFQSGFHETGEIDHAIALKSLSRLTDDGRAVLIVGGVNKLAKSEAARSDAYNGKAKREFYYHLYQNYRVTDHFTVSGDLYEKMGAGWPVDVIVIEGRGKSSRALPAADVPRVYSEWAELTPLLEGIRETAGVDPKPDSSEPRGSAVQPGPADVGGSVRRPAGGKVAKPGGRNLGSAESSGGPQSGLDFGGPVGRGGNRSDEGGRTRPEQPVAAGEAQSAPESGVPVGGEAQGNAGSQGANRPGQAGSAGSASGVGQLAPVASATQATYTPQSKVNAIGTLVPTNMQTAVADALSAIEDKRGPIDAFVATELGYPVAELGKYFSAEQVDALALALNSIKEGKGSIIGDQTGIGKGRVVAGIIRWTLRNGMTPIFVTEKPNLYADMFRDLTDIGEQVINPLATNGAMRLDLDDEGNKVLRTPDSKRHDADMRKMIESASLGLHNMIFTTYNQLQTVKGQRTVRMDLVSTFASNGVVILDESHNAGGQDAGRRNKAQEEAAASTKTGRADFVRSIVAAAKGVFYSSATWAKRPSVMDLYSKTDMILAVEGDASKLPGAISAGGVPLQQVVSAMLTKAGQYIRRERSFAGVEYSTTSVSVDRMAAERIASIMLGIKEFDDAKKAAVEAVKKSEKANASQVSEDGSTGSAGAMSTNFTSVMHNLIDQMLLGLKADQAADLAISRFREGYKPVITVSNTMGSFIEEYVSDVGLKPGDAISLSFADLLRRYLDKSREIVVTSVAGIKSRRKLTDSELGSIALGKFKAVEKLIEGATDLSSVPVSPIDWLYYRLRKEGIKVGEITGRSHTIEYGGSAPVYRVRSGKEVSPNGRRKTITAFNNGGMDVVILNQAGSTGLSLHASEKFLNRKRRRMIIAQAEKNIDTHMQMLGRVHRTGQVVAPGYDQLVADIPAEKRPAAVLAKKMASLNANTTAARGSDFTSKETIDFLNEYGDEVVAQLMADAPEIHVKLGEPLDNASEGDGFEVDDAARKVTGRIPMLPVAEQEALYSMIEAAYKESIARADALGENSLEAKTLELDAKLKWRSALFEASGDSPFAQSAHIEMLNVKRMGKPYTTEHVMEMASKTVGIPATSSLKEFLVAGERKQRESFIDPITEEYKDYRSRVESEMRAGGSEDKAISGRLAALDNASERWKSLMRYIHPGATYRIVTADGSFFYGMVTGVKRKAGVKNPTALGSWVVDVAVADGVRHLSLPLSKVGTNESDIGKVRFNRSETTVFGNPIMPLFDEGQTTSREDRVVVTGNLLAGFSKVGRGQVVNFTRDTGRVEQGILMPRSFDIKAFIDSQPIQLQPDQVVKFLELAPAGIVETADGRFSARKTSRGYWLAAPRSKAEGGRYFLDMYLRSVVGDFESRGNFMVAQVDESAMVRALRYVADKFEQPLQVTAYRAEAKKAGGKPAISLEEKEVPPDSPGVMTSLRPAPVFTSSLTRAAEMAKRDVGTAAEWLGTLSNLPGVKQEEIEWTGIKEWLESQGKVSKAAVIDYLNAHQIEIKEVLKGGQGNSVRERIDNLVVKLTALGYEPTIDEGIMDGGVLESLVRMSDGTPFEFVPDEEKWLAGNEDGDGYSDEEVPPSVAALAEELMDAIGDFDGEDEAVDGTRHKQWQLPGGENYRELLLTFPAAGTRNIGGPMILEGNPFSGVEAAPNEVASYQSTHWSEGNVLAHVRFNDRTDADGKRVLFIEEIQSDWHQAGRKRGYRKGADTNLSIEAEGFERRAVPDAPFKTTWPELILKRMFRHAAENGYDRIAWTTGEQQVERYPSLERLVDTISYFKRDSGQYRVDALKKGRRGEWFNVGVFDESELDAAIGVDVAEQIRAGKGERQKDGSSYISDLHMRLGGDGMRGFYDNILPATVNKMVKKWGARVGKTKIPTVMDPREPHDYLRHFEPHVLKDVHSVDVTPAMRESVLGGQPMFKVVDRNESQTIEANRPTLDNEEFKRRHSLESLQAHVDKLASQWKKAGIKVQVRQNEYDIPHKYTREFYAAGIIGRVHGFIDPNTHEIYLLRENMESLENFEEVLFHEVEGHLSLRQFFGKEITPFLNRVFMADPEGVKRVGIQYGFYTPEGAPSKRVAGDHTEARLNAAEEYAAILAETNNLSRPMSLRKAMDWLMSHFADLMRKAGWRTFKPTKAEIRGWLLRAQYAMRTRDPKPIQQRDKFTKTSNPERTEVSLRLAKASAGERRGSWLMNQLKKGQPVDRSFRMALSPLGYVDDRSHFRVYMPMKRLGKRALKAAMGVAKAGEFAWMNHMGGAAASRLADEYGLSKATADTIEAAKRGLIDRYGLSEEYKKRDLRREADRRTIELEALDLFERLTKAGVDRKEATVLYDMLTGNPVEGSSLQGIADPIIQAIDQMGAEAVELGLLSRESYERNRGAYLHRTYVKHEQEQGSLTKKVGDMLATRRKRIIGNQFKGRGIFERVTAKALMEHTPRDWWGEKRKGESADTALLGRRFTILDRVVQVGGEVETIPGVAPKPAKEVTKQRVYWPADTAVPSKFAGWTNRGSFEVRDVNGDSITLWRDYTREERLRMGEIQDARYAIIKTYMVMARDLATGRFLRDIAQNQEWASKTDPTGESPDAKELGYSLYIDHPWVRVPQTKVAGTNTARWGALAGMYVRSEIWRDLNELDRMQRGGFWQTVLTQWKLNKTARNPVVHMNNIMSNLLFMDMADVRARDLVRGFRSYVEKDEHYKDALRHGAFGGDFVSQEVRDTILKPILDDLTGQSMPGKVDSYPIYVVGMKILSAIRKADDMMKHAYQVEDEIFRMATYMRELSIGETAETAAHVARETFLNYDIRAPWINALRRTVLPFISYTYRAVPVIAKNIYDRPWKLAKYATVAYLMNAMGYALDPEDPDEDEERKLLPEQEQGLTWLGVPRLLRLPTRDSVGNPLYLDIRRWVPAGDVFDFNQNQGALPLPAPLQFGGPMAMAFELAFNRVAFTGEEITNELTDTGMERASKVGDYLWKSYMPSAPWVPGSWYADQIGRAWSGGTDIFQRKYSVPQAFMSSIGLKIKPHDPDANRIYRKMGFDKVDRALTAELQLLQRERGRGLITDAEYRERAGVVREKKERLYKEAAEVLK